MKGRSSCVPQLYRLSLYCLYAVVFVQAERIKLIPFVWHFKDIRSIKDIPYVIVFDVQLFKKTRRLNKNLLYLAMGFN